MNKFTDSQFEDFLNYFADFAKKKRLQLDYGTATVPNRIRKIKGLSLAQAQNTFVKYAIPMTSMHIEKAYLISDPTVETDAQLKLQFDYDQINGQDNFKLLKVNDTYDLDQAVPQFFLAWDAQDDVQVDIAVMIDIRYRSGTLQSAIVGTINSNIVSSIPLVANIPNRTRQFNTSGDSYVVPADSWAKATCFLYGSLDRISINSVGMARGVEKLGMTIGGNGSLSMESVNKRLRVDTGTGGTSADAFAQTNYPDCFTVEYILVADDVIELQSASGTASIHICEFPISS
jgi:hypothetical protein